LEEIIFEVIQVPGDGLAIKAVARVADFVVQIMRGFNLKARQQIDDLLIDVNRLGSNVLAFAILGKKLKKSGVSQVLFQICALAQIFRVNFRHRQAAPPKMAGKLEKSSVFFAHAVANADGREPRVSKTRDVTA